MQNLQIFYTAFLCCIRVNVNYNPSLEEPIDAEMINVKYWAIVLFI
jgi:hypothetical protein